MEDHCEDHSAHQRAIRRHDERMDAHGRELDDLRECVVRLTALQEESAKWRAEADQRIAALEAKPAQRWDALATAIVTGVVGAAVGFAAASIGIG